ncbi:hypothetical protein ACO0OL_001384 [Hanseniaspora opuntiae]
MVAIPISDLVAVSNNNSKPDDSAHHHNILPVDSNATVKNVLDNTNPSSKQNSTSSTPTLPSKEGYHIYRAKYSNVDVYELAHPTGSIMKRKVDNWVNATHILKAANFAKAKRTRILDKDVVNEEHEKVQGGFGKYQGTWVPLSLAISLAKKYNVYEDLKGLLNFVVKDGEAEPEPAPKHTHASKKTDTAKIKKETGVKGKNKKNEPNETLVLDDSKKALKKRKSNKTAKGVQDSLNADSLASSVNQSMMSSMNDLSMQTHSQLLALKRAHSDIEYTQDSQMDNMMSNGMLSVSSGHATSRKQPVKLQRQNTGKGLMLGNDYNSQSATSHISNLLYSPVSGNHVMMGMMSPFGSQSQMYTRSYSNSGTTAQQTGGTSQMKLPSLVAAANVAMSPGFNGNKTRAASRMNSGHYKSGYTTIDEPSQNTMNSLLPSLTTLSTHKSPHLQTPKMNGFNHTSSIRRTPNKGHNAGQEPMTPFYNKNVMKVNDPVVVTLSRNNSVSNQRTQLAKSEGVAKGHTKEGDDAEIEIKFGNALVNNIIMFILTNKEDELNELMHLLQKYESNTESDINDLKKYGIERVEDVAEFQKSFIINSRIDMEGDTLLHLACGIGNIRLIDYILTKCEVNIWKMNFQGDLCFMQMFKYKNCMMREDALRIFELFKQWFLEHDNLISFNKFISFQNFKNENIIHMLLKFKQNLVKSMDEDLETRRILETRFDYMFDETLEFIDKISLTRMLIHDQENLDGNTPLHVALLVLKDEKVYDKMITMLRIKYMDDAHTFSKLCEVDMKQVLNSKGEFMYRESVAITRANEENMEKYNKMYERINVRIIPKIRELLMGTLNKAYMNQELMRIENLKNNALRMKIDEMKMKLDMKILEEFVYEKKVEENNVFGFVKNEDVSADVKLEKVREIQRLMLDNEQKTRDYYTEASMDRAVDYRRIVSRFMDVPVVDVDMAMIDKMLDELE